MVLMAVSKVKSGPKAIKEAEAVSTLAVLAGTNRSPLLRSYNTLPVFASCKIMPTGALGDILRTMLSTFSERPLCVRDFLRDSILWDTTEGVLAIAAFGPIHTPT